MIHSSSSNERMRGSLVKKRIKMERVFVANSWWYLVINSSLLSKSILALAFAVLVLSTFILFFKMWDIREKRKQVIRARKMIHDVNTFDDMLSLGASVKSTLAGAVMSKGLQTVKMLLQTHTTESVKSMTHEDFTALQDALAQAVDQSAYHQREYLPFLYAAASTAPLVGLFGTVSGLITAFVSMGSARTSDITVLAPGIAEALLTTLAGLLVAIPVLLMYHYLAHAVSDLEFQLERLGHRMSWKIKELLVPQG